MPDSSIAGITSSLSLSLPNLLHRLVLSPQHHASPKSNVLI